MKKRVLKKWFQNLLIIINIICVIVFACENYDLKSMLICNGIAFIVFIISNYVLFKYTDLFDKEV